MGKKLKFKFALGQTVKIRVGLCRGEVIGRADHTKDQSGEHRYKLRYLDFPRRQLAYNWFAESELKALAHGYWKLKGAMLGCRQGACFRKSRR